MGSILGSNLIALRKSKQCELKDVSQQTGISEDDIRSFEFGIKQPTVDEANRLASYYNVAPSSLYTTKELHDDINKESKKIRENRSKVKIEKSKQKKVKQDKGYSIIYNTLILIFAVAITVSFFIPFAKDIEYIDGQNLITLLLSNKYAESFPNILYSITKVKALVYILYFGSLAIFFVSIITIFLCVLSYIPIVRRTFLMTLQKIWFFIASIINIAMFLAYIVLIVLSILSLEKIDALINFGGIALIIITISCFIQFVLFMSNAYRVHKVKNIIE